MPGGREKLTYNRDKRHSVSHRWASMLINAPADGGAGCVHIGHAENMREFAKAFYKSRAWQQCRAGYIAYRRGLDGGMCEICQEVPGYIVHHKQHITPHNINNPDVTLNWSNLQYVCKHCHDVEHGYCDQSKPSRVTFDADGNPIPPPENGQGAG